MWLVRRVDLVILIVLRYPLMLRVKVLVVGIRGRLLLVRRELLSLPGYGDFFDI